MAGSLKAQLRWPWPGGGEKVEVPTAVDREEVGELIAHDDREHRVGLWRERSNVSTRFPFSPTVLTSFMASQTSLQLRTWEASSPQHNLRDLGVPPGATAGSSTDSCSTMRAA